MIAAVVNVKRYDWATWFIGIQRAFITGLAGAAVNTSATIGIDPQNFNFGPQLKHTILLATLSALGGGMVHMLVFLQTHPAPEAVPVQMSSTAMQPPDPQQAATLPVWPPPKR